jgi:hypothetical protein
VAILLAVVSNFSLLQNVQNCANGHTSSCSKRASGFLPAIKRKRYEGNHTHTVFKLIIFGAITPLLPTP